MLSSGDTAAHQSRPLIASAATGLSFTAAALVFAASLVHRSAPATVWLVTAAVGLSALATALELRLQVPWQNVLVIGLLLTGAPLGLGLALASWHEDVGGQFLRFGVQPRPAFWLPLWFVIGASSRSAAKALLARRNRASTHGYEVLGLAGTLAFLEFLGFGLSFGHAPIAGAAALALGRALVSLLLLALLTPWFIRKSPAVRDVAGFGWTWPILTAAVYGALLTSLR